MLLRSSDAALTVCFSQRQQVVLTQHWAKANGLIHFSVMHPGWVDTPGTTGTPFPVNIGSPVVCELLLVRSRQQLISNERKIREISHLITVFPAVSESMPQFHRMMGERLRRVEQGADTVVWLAVSKAAVKTPSGQFFQGQWVPFFDRVGSEPRPR